MNLALHKNFIRNYFQCGAPSFLFGLSDQLKQLPRNLHHTSQKSLNRGEHENLDPHKLRLHVFAQKSFREK